MGYRKQGPGSGNRKKRDEQWENEEGLMRARKQRDWNFETHKCTIDRTIRRSLGVRKGTMFFRPSRVMHLFLGYEFEMMIRKKKWNYLGGGLKMEVKPPETSQPMCCRDGTRQ